MNLTRVGILFFLSIFFSLICLKCGITGSCKDFCTGNITNDIKDIKVS